MPSRVHPIAAVAVVGALVLTGCSGFDASKSGGGAGPIHVNLASGDLAGRVSSAAVETFAREVEERSGGSIVVEIRWRSFLGDGGGDPGAATAYEGPTYSEVARQVQDDEVELAIVPDFAWIDRGSETIEALKVPFLIDSVGLMREVARRVDDEALADLPSLGAIPLAVMPEALRHPVGFGRSITTPADFDGHRLRMSDSAAGPVLQAWGAEPIETVGGFAAAVHSGDIDGADSTFALAGTLPSLGTYTADISYLAKFTTIVASSAWWGTLSDAQRQAVQDAATATREDVMATLEDDVAAGAAYCKGGGTVVRAGPAAVGELERAVRPIADALRSAPATGDTVRRIEQLKAEFPPAIVAAECSPADAAPVRHPSAGAGDPEETAAFPQGSFRARLTAKDFTDRGVSTELANDHSGPWTLIFRDGRVEGIDCPGSTYSVDGGRISVVLGTGAPGCGEAAGHELFSARWTYDGTALRFTDIGPGGSGPPMQTFSEVLWGSHDWVKVQ